MNASDGLLDSIDQLSLPTDGARTSRDPGHMDRRSNNQIQAPVVVPRLLSTQPPSPSTAAAANTASAS